MSCPSPWDLPNPGVEPRSPTLQADSLPSESQRKSKKTGVGSLFLLQGIQGIFSTQESNRGLLHCLWILYQLTTREAPSLIFGCLKMGTMVVVIVIFFKGKCSALHCVVG